MKLRDTSKNQRRRTASSAEGARSIFGIWWYSPLNKVVHWNDVTRFYSNSVSFQRLGQAAL